MKNNRLVVRGLRIALLGCNARDEQHLLQQFRRLGIMGIPFTEPEPDTLNSGHDMVIFDSDNNILLRQLEAQPWPECPKIALLGSEAPSRLLWIINQDIDGYLRKPMKSEGIFSTILLAMNQYRRKQDDKTTIAKLEIRVKSRKFLLSAQILLMNTLQCDEQQSYILLRRFATERQTTVEELSIELLARPHEWLQKIKSRSCFDP